MSAGHGEMANRLVELAVDIPQGARHAQQLVIGRDRAALEVLDKLSDRGAEIQRRALRARDALARALVVE